MQQNVIASIHELEWNSFDSEQHLIAPSLKSLLLEEGSLTKRMKAMCKSFRVELIQQAWGRPLNFECEALQLNDNASVNVREVRLHCDEKPWIYARSVIPEITVQNTDLLNLGTRPLGEVLFTDPTIERRHLKIAAIDAAKHTAFHPFIACNHPEPHPILWGRHSVFVYLGFPLLVAEYFTPWVPVYAE